MAASFFFSSSQCALATNAPNLVSVTTFQARAAGTLSSKGNIPQFDVQRTSMGAKTNAPNLSDAPVFRANAICTCSTQRMARLYGRLPESSLAAQNSNQFVGNHHRIVTPLTMPITRIDTYIDWFSWSGMLGAGHVMEIIDSRGSVLAREVSGQASDGSFFRVKVGRVAVGGYSVQTLDSGILQITTGKVQRNSFAGRA